MRIQKNLDKQNIDYEPQRSPYDREDVTTGGRVRK